jgi:CRISPR-associated endonuclease/helicase Cas3
MKGEYCLNEIPGVVLDLLSNSKNILVVCNTKKEAQALFRALKDTECIQCFHLSASMCMDHRKRILRKIKRNLSSGKKTICISTQVIEAGVDLSFQTVVRFSAGLENIIQSGGRGNRNGEYGKVENVYIINCKDENGKNLPDEIQMAKNAFTGLFVKFKENPGKFDHRLDSDEAIDEYYSLLNLEAQGKSSANYSDFIISDKSTTVFELLSENEKFASLNPDSGYFLKQAFRKAGKEFLVFSENKDVIVPYKEGTEYIEELREAINKNKFNEIKHILKKLKPFTVNMSNETYNKLRDTGGIELLLEERISVLDKHFYDENIGFVSDVPKDGIFVD